MSIGERAENIAEQFKLRQVSTEQALKQLQELVNEINAARREQAARNISAESLTVYWLLTKIGRATPESAEKAAADMKAITA